MLVTKKSIRSGGGGRGGGGGGRKNLSFFNSVPLYI